MKRLLSVALLAGAPVFTGCAGTSPSNPAGSAVIPAHITSGGSGQAIAAGACIAPGGRIPATDVLSSGASVTVRVLSNGPSRGTYTVSDTFGAVLTVPEGAVVTFDGATMQLVSLAPAAMKNQSFTIVSERSVP
jgi:hypothetical protein